MKINIASFTALIILSAGPVTADSSYYSTTLAQLPDYLESKRNEFRLPSISVGIVYDTAIIFAEAYGFADVQNKIPAGKSTIYKIGSVTKLFTATMLVRLSEKGVVRLDDRVDKYVREYKPSSEWAGTQPTTLRQLATHMSGLSRQGPLSFFSDQAAYVNRFGGEAVIDPPQITKEEFIKSLDKIELEFPPNDQFGHYSNLGFKILGIALERACKSSFEAYIKSEILMPLGMNSSGFDISDIEEIKLAVGEEFYAQSDSSKRVPIDSPGWDIYAGGMYATAEDLCRFLSLQFQNEPVGGKQIISGDGLRMMQWQAMDWAFRWDAVYPSLEHGGSVPGFSADVIIIPGLKIGIAVLSNGNNLYSTEAPIVAITREISQKFLSAAKAANKAPLPVSIDSLDLTAYAGSYSLGKGIARIEIKLEHDGLVFSVVGFEEFKSGLKPLTPQRFGFIDADAKDVAVEFEFNIDRSIKGLKLGSYFFRKLKN